MFEFEKFAQGTNNVAHLLADLTQNNGSSWEPWHDVHLFLMGFLYDTRVS